MNDKMNYIEKDGVLYPDVEMPEQKEIGKWGLLHLGWLKRFRVARYNELLMLGELNEYLYKVNEEAQERFESLIVDLSESHGLSEELKARVQMPPRPDHLHGHNRPPQRTKSAKPTEHYATSKL